ncbi:MAG: hypothetical protein ACLRMW_12860 [[Clostridium] symbiosum]
MIIIKKDYPRQIESWCSNTYTIMDMSSAYYFAAGIGRIKRPQLRVRGLKSRILGARPMESMSPGVAHI